MQITDATSAPSTPTPAAAPMRARQARTIGSTLVVLDQELPEHAVPGRDPILALGQVVYSIQLPAEPGETDCARCGECFRAAGPTGHANEEPICDVCLVECEEELGMVLALVAVVRTFTAERYASPEEYWDALEEVGAFARVYERVAARSGPVRLFVRKLSRRTS